MIVLDIETTGLYPTENGIIELAALKFEKPLCMFHSFCRIDEDDIVDPKALEINGQSEKEVRDKNRLTQKQILEKLFDWMRVMKDFYIAGENVGGIDYNFIKAKARKYNLDLPIQLRSLDLQTVAQTRYKQVHGKFLIKNGKSELSLSKTLEFVGLKDERGKHNALEDAKLEAECFSRLLNGKNLFSEYSKFKIPSYLGGKND